eukprot:363754-Chlamydomonas_euryale.AAC.4
MAAGTSSVVFNKWTFWLDRRFVNVSMLNGRSGGCSSEGLAQWAQRWVKLGGACSMGAAVGDARKDLLNGRSGGCSSEGLAQRAQRWVKLGGACSMGAAVGAARRGLLNGFGCCCRRSFDVSSGHAMRYGTEHFGTIWKSVVRYGVKKKGRDSWA